MKVLVRGEGGFLPGLLVGVDLRGMMGDSALGKGERAEVLPWGYGGWIGWIVGGGWWWWCFLKGFCL